MSQETAVSVVCLCHGDADRDNQVRKCNITEYYKYSHTLYTLHVVITGKMCFMFLLISLEKLD